MSQDDIAALLGLPIGDSRIEDVLRQFGVMRRPELAVDPDDGDGPVAKSQDWVSNLSIGIEFGFQEEAALMGLDEADFSAGPALLSEVYFYGAREGVRPYPHPLPFGLALDDDRATVRRKLSRMDRTRRSYVRDTWEHPAFRITVSYADSGGRIDFVLCLLRTEPFEPFEGGMSRLPSTDVMIGLLGKPLDDPAIRQVFVPLGLDRQVLAGTAEQAIEFRRTYGFKLGLRNPGRVTAPLLQRIEYLREGEFESRGWRGELPFGIDFNDSPEVVMEKVGLAPTSQDDQDFSGQAYWELPDYGLQVAYSTMENIVLRVCVLSLTTSRKAGSAA